jgi:hypothetical protein
MLNVIMVNVTALSVVAPFSVPTVMSGPNKARRLTPLYGIFTAQNGFKWDHSSLDICDLTAK